MNLFAMPNIENNRVLLIQETLPWSSNANTEVLKKLGLSYTMIGMKQFADINLSQYYMVIVANDQVLSFYQDYISVKNRLEKFVEGGGVLVMGACDAGWASGTLNEGLPGNVKLAPVRYDENNVIADNNHPLITGTLTDHQILNDTDLK